MREGCALLLMCVLASVVSAADFQQRPTGIGREIGEHEAASYGRSVLPSGAGLPRGSGSAKKGRELYFARCAACHGDSGEGRADFHALVGGRGSLSTDKPVLTVGSYWPTATTLFDYIWRAMPYQEPGSLTAGETYALTAWILSANGVISENQVMDRKSLIRVRMPNRDGFVSDPRPDVANPHKEIP